MDFVTEMPHRVDRHRVAMVERHFESLDDVPEFDLCNQFDTYRRTLITDNQD